MGHGRSGTGLGRTTAAPTIERGRRCENCQHWDNGERAIQHYKAKRFADLQRDSHKILERTRLGDQDGSQLQVAKNAAKLQREGWTPAQAERIAVEASQALSGTRSQTRDFSDLDETMRALGVNYDHGDKLMRAGLLGICGVDAAPGDFVHKDFFCGTRYNASVVVDEAHKHDETPEEARNRLGLDS